MAEATLRSVDDLVTDGLVRAEEAGTLDAVAARYAIALTPTVRALIDVNDPSDPIAAQYVPSADELVEIGFEDSLRAGVVLVEWPERAAELIGPDHIEISIADARTGTDGGPPASHARSEARSPVP